MQHFKYRVNNERPEIGENRRLSFYAAIWNAPTLITHDRDKQPYTEVLLPNPFTFDNEVTATIDHDKTRTFAKLSTGELLLQQDKHGLFATCYLPETELGDQIIRDVEAGRICGASAGWRIGKERINGDYCEVESGSLFDVCVTGAPAYDATIGEVKLRSEQQALTLRRLFTKLKILKLKDR